MDVGAGTVWPADVDMEVHMAAEKIVVVGSMQMQRWEVVYRNRKHCLDLRRNNSLAGSARRVDGVAQAEESDGPPGRIQFS